MQDILSIHRHFTQVGLGAVSYLAAGDSSHQWVVLLHGIPASAEIWRGVLPMIAAHGYYAVAPDLPGYGHTRVKSPGDMGLMGAAVLLDQWLSLARPTSVTLVGHDLGGAVAQVYLTVSSNKPQKVVLINCPVADSWPVPSVQRLISVANKGLFALLACVGAFKEKRFQASLSRSFVNPHLLSTNTFRKVFYDGKFHRWGTARRFEQMLRHLNVNDTLDAWLALPEVSEPVCLIWGMQDSYQPWANTGARLQTQLPNIRKVHHFDNCGHFVPLDAQEALVEALLAFLSIHKS